MTKNKQESLETLVTLIALELSKHTETATAIIEILADDEITKLGHEVFGQSFSSQSLRRGKRLFYASYVCLSN